MKDSQSNDSLFLYFSGHGGQTVDLDGDEVDGQDEFICPVDFKTAGVIVDDELKTLLSRWLPKGVREEIKLNYVIYLFNTYNILGIITYVFFLHSYMATYTSDQNN